MILMVLELVMDMEVDKVADEVTNMEVDRVTNMMAKITNEDLDVPYGAVLPPFLIVFFSPSGYGKWAKKIYFSQLKNSVEIII